jgi:hypothetical protein
VTGHDFFRLADRGQVDAGIPVKQKIDVNRYLTQTRTVELDLEGKQEFGDLGRGHGLIVEERRFSCSGIGIGQGFLKSSNGLLVGPLDSDFYECPPSEHSCYALSTMPAKTIQEQLEELSSRMVQEQDPKTFNSLVKEMSQLLAVEGMNQLLAARESRVPKPAEKV